MVLFFVKDKFWRIEVQWTKLNLQSSSGEDFKKSFPGLRPYSYLGTYSAKTYCGLITVVKHFERWKKKEVHKYYFL